MADCSCYVDFRDFLLTHFTPYYQDEHFWYVSVGGHNEMDRAHALALQAMAYSCGCPDTAAQEGFLVAPLPPCPATCPQGGNSVPFLYKCFVLNAAVGVNLLSLGWDYDCFLQTNYTEFCSIGTGSQPGDCNPCDELYQIGVNDYQWCYPVPSTGGCCGCCQGCC